LVRLHVDEEERRGVTLLLVGELTAEARLEQRDGDEEHHADAEGHDHPDRVASGAVEAGEALAPGQPRHARQPPRELHEPA